MDNQKGISLPVETIVIIAIVVLVMVVLVAFFIGGSGKQISSISNDDAFGKGCVILSTQYKCEAASDTVEAKNAVLRQIQIKDYHPDGKTSGTLRDACDKKGLGEFCWASCGCPPP